MAYGITQFENNLTNALALLDQNFTTVCALAPIPCSIAGSANALILTPSAAGLVPTLSIAAYTTGMYFTGISTAQNLGATTATVGSLATLPVYKDTQSGPAVLVGNEIKPNNAIGLLYDAALNGGNGGFHLVASTAIANTQLQVSSLQINNSNITGLASGSVNVTFTATPGWSSQDQTFTVSGVAPALPNPGDFMQINPPSLAAAGVSYQGYCTAIGSLSSVASVATVNIRLINSASASLASNSGLYRWMSTRVTP